MLHKTSTIVLLCAGLLAAGPAAASGNPELGKAKSATCVACHGADGKGIAPTFPVIAGQHADYLILTLKQYRSGERNNAQMAPMAANLSDDDIADLAAYYSQLPGLKTPKP
ncbi:cytochrome c [Thioalkalivibrio sp. XN8]|uniref:c-type cytochrome n=1 Tax=Thioalkalivibrio sp. XN8 TaxID=2712863 RepID=UPI0013ECCBE3|nr:cytochrome c [Thioalkalivibrio sp. XN8]NGP52493.1 cytochrome c [Thioalkalivibrio sp. XN8]